MCTAMCKTDTWWEPDLQHRELSQCALVTYTGALQCRGEYTREGIRVQIQLIHFAAQQTPTEHCKATIVQLKKNGNFDSSKVIVKR